MNAPRWDLPGDRSGEFLPQERVHQGALEDPPFGQAHRLHLNVGALKIAQPKDELFARERGGLRRKVPDHERGQTELTCKLTAARFQRDNLGWAAGLTMLLILGMLTERIV